MKQNEISRIDISSGQVKYTTDFVAEELPLHVFLNNTRLTTILCSPFRLKELAIGHLLSEGVIEKLDEIQEIYVDKQKHTCQIHFKPPTDITTKIEFATPFSRVITSSCNQWNYLLYPKLVDRITMPTVGFGFSVKAEVVAKGVKNLRTFASIYRKTGGVHIAALYKGDGALVAFAEDVGRHNAVDKVIGISALQNRDPGNCFLALSGRLTGNIVLKAARVGLPIIASKAAAIKYGIEAAKRCNITLVGFVRGNRMNVYTHPNRIKIQ